MILYNNNIISMVEKISVSQTPFYVATKNLYATLLEFKKPRLTETLLSRPPFLFIFDIVVELNRITGFCQQTFKPEDWDREKCRIKEFKIEFLRKLIGIVKSNRDNNRILQVNPMKIAAGLECELTNILLQEMFYAATKDYNFDAVSPTKPEPI